MDYQKTLNLPKTSFSMRAGLVQKEPAYLEKWETDHIYQQIRRKSENRKTFILHDGPPYANGNIHIGHALNKILKDFIVKFRTMQGFDSIYVPGWDCHGLPIEHKLLAEMKQRKSEVDCVEFRKKAHEYALKYVEIQKEQFKRLGIFGEWDRPYLTLTPDYEYWILHSLANLNRDGYVYRGLKPVNWCFDCETALAEAEVEYEDHSSPTVYVKFQVKNPDVLGLDLPHKKVSVLIWTTTPWTLMANVAVAVHPHFKYHLVDLDEEILIIESSLTEHVMQKAGIDRYKVIKGILGEHLTDLRYEQPFGMLEECPIVCADYVTKEDGTGLVHTAPGHGQDDFETGLANNLPVIMPVDDRGCYTQKAKKYQGQHVLKANKLIIEDLQIRDVILFKEDIRHSYPHCWRCKKPIIFRATEQWFLKIDHLNLRGRLLAEIQENVKWIPSAGKERITSMVSGRPDWCLSRQRFWGVPIPALECRGCDGQHKLFTEVIDHFAALVKDHGTNIWFERDIKDLLPEGFSCPDCGKSDFVQTKDILDVWFDSGVSHQAVAKNMLGQELPIDMYLEGSDQHRGWFQSSLISSVAMEGKAPYKSVLTHGFVVDGQGRKMSKSLGNVISPQDVLPRSGADILRLWIASSSYNEDIRISKEILDRLIDAYRKIRNTIRFLLGNLNGFDVGADVVPYSQMLDLDKWVLNRLGMTMQKVVQQYESYEFSKVYKTLYNFCNEDLSSFYLDILKDRLYTSSTKSVDRKSAQTALFNILNHFVRVLAPILCFTSDEIFQSMPKDQDALTVPSVHLLEWLTIPDEWLNEEIIKEFELLTAIRPFVLKALEDKRRDGDIGSSLEAKVIIRTASDRDKIYFKQREGFLPAAFIVSQVEIHQVEDIKNCLSEFFGKTEIVIVKAQGDKCPRCWNYKMDIGEVKEHKTLCARCAEIVKEFVNDAAEENG
ncbi:MAG: isoleucine--tRNA ligase [Candidatus Omnitrophica bacterium]|nr:isoleucine--tRNA ligase [Candidatus Omnitrophota bacterium]